MAGHGRPPKLAGERRRYNQPARSEWVDLPELSKPVLPAHRRAWSVPKWMWDLWRRDPVTSQYTSGDIAAIMDLGQRWAEFAPNEQRLRLTVLGLNAKGRRDLRWRTPLEAEQQVVALEKAKEVRRMRLVSEKETA